MLNAGCYCLWNKAVGRAAGRVCSHEEPWGGVVLQLLFSRLESCRLVADVQDFAVVFSPLEKDVDSGGPAWIQAGTAEIRSEPGLGCVALIWFWALQLEPG